jgi:flagellar protein FliS
MPPCGVTGTHINKKYEVKTMAANNPYTTYKKQSVSTMTAVELVIRLYDECERQISRAIHFIEKKNYAEKNAALMKTLEITEYLQGTLDMSVEISNELNAIYNYFENQIIAANMRNDTDKLRKILPQFRNIKESFVQISHMTKEQIASQSQKNLQPEPTANIEAKVAQ